MKTIIKAAIAALGFLAFSAHAELFKCKQPDGTTAFQDYACGTAGPGPRQPAPQPMPNAAGGNPGVPGTNQACAQETTAASRACAPESDAYISKCVASTLSPRCAQQFQQTVDKRDAACMREIPAKLQQCLPAMKAVKSQCMASKLPPVCRQQ